MKQIFIVLLASGFVHCLCAQDSSAIKINDLLTAYTKLSRFNGTALVARQDKIIFEKGYGLSNAEHQTSNNPHTIFQIASITKQFTATVILKLVEQKKMALTDKLSKYYPDFPKGEDITIENLLTHISGIFDYTHEDTVTHLDSEQKMMSFLKKKQLDFTPGTDWSYSNSGYSILGFIIQKVSGITYEQAVRKYIFKPLQMNSSGFDFEHLVNKEKATGYTVYSDSIKTAAPYSDSAIVFAAGSIYSTVEDLYKWHEGLQHYRIVGKMLMEKAYTPFKKNYGYGWIIDSVAERRMLYHSGGISGFSSNIARIPEDGVCIVLLNNKEGREMETITRKIIDILYNKPYTLPGKKKAVTLSLSMLEKYTGTYQLESPRLVIEISIDNGNLVAHAVNGPTFPLFAEKENLFFIQDDQAEIAFIPGADSRVEKIELYQNGQKNPGRKIK